jgi:hypothetical protein
MQTNQRLLRIVDGTYHLRLHFVEPTQNTIGSRVFDIVQAVAITGADTGIWAPTVTTGVNSTGIVIRNNTIFENGLFGVRMEMRNDESVIEITFKRCLRTPRPAWAHVETGSSVDPGNKMHARRVQRVITMVRSPPKRLRYRPSPTPSRSHVAR